MEKESTLCNSQPNDPDWKTSICWRLSLHNNQLGELDVDLTTCFKNNAKLDCIMYKFVGYGRWEAGVKRRMSSSSLSSLTTSQTECRINEWK
ncbi:hypothetical protein Leryth_014484 [Lithospermum erythrorhizon]|nr:hypothetical protein Leryth_014484 [Lithospermum erythrorhizon]